MNYEEINTKARLIVKYQQHALSESEKAELEDWLEQSEENRATVEQICSENFIHERRQELQMFNSNKGFARFRQASKPQNRPKIARWYRSVAACAIILFTAGASIFILNQQDKTPESHILYSHGFPQAKLTLANGQTIEFSGAKQDTLALDGAELIAYGTKIEYTATGQTTTDYNTLEVPRKGEFFLRLSDGTKVWLNSETKLRYPVAFTGEQRVVYVEGEAFFEVKKDINHPFIVKMPSKKEIEVTGTSFNVRSYSNEGASQITLVSGKVNLKNDKHRMELSPGEQGEISSGNSEIQKQKVNANLYTSWKNGRFVFKEQPLEEIMKTISRWYDVKIVFADEQVKQATFSGNLQRYDDFSKIIRMLEVIQIAKFEVKGNHICIYEYKKAN